MYEQDNPFFTPKAQLSVADFDWQGVEKPDFTDQETILYETHVKGYTKKFPAGAYQVPCALIIGQRKESTDKKTSLNQALRDNNVSV